nr:YtxH domain-containing protein [uncultured Winogradskyella sp.]
MAGDAKEKVKEVYQDAKEATSDFADDAKEVLSDGKNIGIIAHITLIGWIIALVMNSSKKTEFGSFYIRQMLGLMLIGFATGWIPILGLIIGFVLFIAWVMSLISALGGEQKPVFLLGAQFQEWFKGL